MLSSNLRCFLPTNLCCRESRFQSAKLALVLPVLPVAASHASHGSVVVAGVAGLVAGAMSMASGEYVSVHSQADTEDAELALERTELKTDVKGEHDELTAIYVARGLQPALAKQVAEQLMSHDALGAHARDELGISDTFPSASYASRISIGRQLCHRSRHAACNHSFGIRFFADPPGFGCFPGFPCAIGWAGRARGWGGSMDWGYSSYVWGALAMAVTAAVGWIFGTVV
jgi:vacuolar iron transporter family protein